MKSTLYSKAVEEAWSMGLVFVINSIDTNHINATIKIKYRILRGGISTWLRSSTEFEK